MARVFGDLGPGCLVLEWKYGRGGVRRVAGCGDGELALEGGMTHTVRPGCGMEILNKGGRMARHLDENWLLFADYRQGQRVLQDMALREKRANDRALEGLRDAIRKGLLRKEDAL